MTHFVVKGDRVTAQWFECDPLGSYSLAEYQTKFNAKPRFITGEVRHIRSDQPTNPVNVTLHVQSEGNLGTLCPKCQVYEVEVRLEWVTQVYPKEAPSG
jgi:hypothetical protein